jgi:NADH dehydrogenase (ubiquinone) flavoprotein 2
MIQVNGEWVYEDLTPENTVQLLEDLKAGTDKKGPQINRNDCEGPQGRTTLIVIFTIFRASTWRNKYALSAIL